MRPKGRPALTEEVVRQRIAAYCARYGVTELGAQGFPAFPTGKRETRQHREWVVLYKTFSRLRRRAAAAPSARGAEPASEGPCPICAETLNTDDPIAAHGRPARVHARCRELLALAAGFGPSVLERLREHLWPSATLQRRPPARRR